MSTTLIPMRDGDAYDPYEEVEFCPGCDQEFCVCDVCKACMGTGWTEHSGIDDTPGQYECRECGGMGDR